MLYVAAWSSSTQAGMLYAAQAKRATGPCAYPHSTPCTSGSALLAMPSRYWLKRRVTARRILVLRQSTMSSYPSFVCSSTCSACLLLNGHYHIAEATAAMWYAKPLEGSAQWLRLEALALLGASYVHQHGEREVYRRVSLDRPWVPALRRRAKTPGVAIRRDSVDSHPTWPAQRLAPIGMIECIGDEHVAEVRLEVR